MSEERVSRAEFDLFIKMNSETNDRISNAITAIQEQGQETLNVLKEYVIHNNHKHDTTNDRIISLALEMKDLREAVVANAKITQFWSFVGRYIKYIAIGTLTAIGGLIIAGYTGLTK